MTANRPLLRLGLPGVFMLVCCLIEGIVLGASFGLWGQANWRDMTHALGAFRPDLLFGTTAIYPLQPVVMFLSYAVLHDGPLHLAGNLLTLMVLGREVRRLFGESLLMPLGLVSALSGAAAFAVLSSSGAPMIGASGVAFGLAGALAARQRGRFLEIALGLAMANVALWALLSGQLAWEAHLGGFLGGLAFAGLAGKSGPGSGHETVADK